MHGGAPLLCCFRMRERILPAPDKTVLRSVRLVECAATGGHVVWQFHRRSLDSPVE